MRSANSRLLDQDYVAAGIATELVRIHLSTNHYLKTSAQARDVSLLLTLPLETVAGSLGVRQRVDELVRNALSVVEETTRVRLEQGGGEHPGE